MSKTSRSPASRSHVALTALLCLLCWGTGSHLAAQEDPGGDDDWLDETPAPADTPADDETVGDEVDDDDETTTSDEERRFQRFPFDLLLPLGWGSDDDDAPDEIVAPTREAVVEFLNGLDRTARSELIDEILAAEDPQADTLYQVGVEALAAGRYAAAADALNLFAIAWPEDPRAHSARELATLASGWIANPPPDPRLRPSEIVLTAPDPTIDEYSSGIELVTVMSLYGLYSGLAPSITYDLEVGGAVLTTFTTLAGFGGTLIGIWGNEIEEYAVQAIENGLLIGGWHGLALTPIIKGEDAPGEDGAMASWVGATVGGGVATALAFLVLDQDDGGDIALVNSGALWGTFVAGMTTVATVQDLEEVLYPAVLIGTDLGLAAMAAAAPWLDVTRERMLVIDLSGMGGAVLASGIMLAAYGNEGVPRGIFGGVNLLGAAAGIGLAAWLTE